MPGVMPMIPDNLDLMERILKQKEAALARLPVCSECGEHIQDEYAYYINAEWICADCMESFRREIYEE
ncbi:hypothetical protein [Treponema sp.]|uniref:hypothetical protein n=1 Tax=Treponema sp. TaxID=166 RepID=UPI00388F4A08